MRKFLFLAILIFEISFFTIPKLVGAEELTSSYNDAIKICEYKNKIRYVPKSDLKNAGDGVVDTSKTYPNEKILYARFAIFYSIEKEKYETVAEKYKNNDLDEIKIVRKKYSKASLGKENILTTTDNKRYGGEDIEKIIKNFACPEYVMYNHSPSDTYAMDFYYDDISLVLSHWGHGWEMPNSSLTYVLKDEINDLVSSKIDEYISKNFSVNENEKLENNPFCSQLKDDYEDNTQIKQEFVTKIENEMLKVIIDTYFSNTGWTFDNHKLPNSILDLEAFSKINDLVNSGIDNARQKCINVYNNEENLTDEEREDYIENMDYNLDVIEYELGEYANMRVRLSGEYQFDWSGKEDCEGFLGLIEDESSPAYYLNLIMKIMKYSAVILVFVLSIMDFTKAITNQDKDQLKKSAMIAIKRLIAAIIIFFLPILINFILSLLGAYNTCGL